LISYVKLPRITLIRPYCSYSNHDLSDKMFHTIMSQWPTTAFKNSIIKITSVIWFRAKHFRCAIYDHQYYTLIFHIIIYNKTVLNECWNLVKPVLRTWTVVCTWQYRPWTDSIKPSLQHWQVCAFFVDSLFLKKYSKNRVW
jgi:hypothetical protein